MLEREFLLHDEPEAGDVQTLPPGDGLPGSDPAMKCQCPECPSCIGKGQQRTFFAQYGQRFLCWPCWSDWMRKVRTVPAPPLRPLKGKPSWLTVAIYTWIDKRHSIPFWVRWIWPNVHWCPEMDEALILGVLGECFCGYDREDQEEKAEEESVSR